MIEPKLEASVGLSRKWDARDAGREVAETAIKNLSEPPSFFLLFSTIHYEKYGGFQEFLDGVWDVLPEGTPLIGGTVTGFTNNYGCFTRGATALAVSYPNMDAAVGRGMGSKKSPKKAARGCIDAIKSGLKDSKYENKYIFSIISGIEMVKFPSIEMKIVMEKSFTTSFAKEGLKIMPAIWKKGPGSEEEVLEEIIRELPDYSLMHGSSFDDIKLRGNYQFFNRNVLTDSAVVLGLRTDINFSMQFQCGANPEKGKSFRISKRSMHNRMIDEINNENALQQYINATELGEIDLNNKNASKIIPYFPILLEKDGQINLRSIGAVLGDSLFIMGKVNQEYGKIAKMTGYDLVHAVEKFTEGETKLPSFGLFSSCAVRLATLGRNVFKTREILLDFFKERPFLVIHTAGEATYSPEKGLNYLNESIASTIFWDKA